MAKKKEVVVEEIIQENISVEPLEELMGDRYATYAKYVIQDRAIPDVRDGLKPVQRRIIYSMFKSGNTFNKPTKKCAHTVGAVMGTYHPHGDTSIYEALARMSQDWKVRYPLIAFQGNNGSIDGDSPAAYRYTEAKLSELSNEMIKDIEKDTVNMQWNFDDTVLEPSVLPSKFPNLLVNGAEGIAVGLATEIPPHNLREVVDAVIYRISHKTATIEELMQFVQGPDFPMGGYIYRSEGLDSIYQTGRGRIEVVAKCEIVEGKDINQIIIDEIPYKVQKNLLVYDIDKIRHSKAIDGIIEVRDESEGEEIRIAIDIKKTAKAELVLRYLMNKTNLRTNYSANMVAIVNGHPKTLNLLDFVDAYIAHQIEVFTRKTNYDLDRNKKRLHIVEGLILASININEVVEIIKKSKDKADSKVNLIKRFSLSEEQAEAIVTMPLYKLSHTDEIVLENEKKQLTKEIETMEAILADPTKLNKCIIKELKSVADKYGDDRRTKIIDKVEEKKIDKRELIAEETVMLAVTYDGYVKRSSVKSYRSSDDSLPGMKENDMLVTSGTALTTDYLVCFTNYGNYITAPVHELTDTKWKDEGTHLNNFATLAAGEKIIKAIAVHDFRNDIYLALLSKYGQIKRMNLSSIEVLKRSRPARCMRLLNNDSVAGIGILTGNSDIIVTTSDGKATMFNENDLSIIGTNAGGVKSVSGLGSNTVCGIVTLDQEEKGKLLLYTNKGHQRIVDIKNINKTNRLGKVSVICENFKSDKHSFISVMKIKPEAEAITTNLYLDNLETLRITIGDLKATDALYARRNIKELPAHVNLTYVFDTSLETINKNSVSHPIIVKETPIKAENAEQSNEENGSTENSEAVQEKEVEQISLFDELEN